MNETFEVALEAIEEHAKGCWDRTLGADQLFATSSGGMLIKNGGDIVTRPTKYALERMLGRLTTKSTQWIKTRPHVSLGQLYHLCSRPGGKRNGGYGTIDLELRSKIVNNLLKFHPGLEWLARCRNEDDLVSLRALLSDSFKPFDHLRFMQSVLNPDAGLAEVGKVHGMSIGDYAEDLYLKIVCPGTEVEINGETYLPGFRFVNGELGNRRIGIDPFIYRAKCINDMVVQTDFSFHRKHTGDWPDELLTAAFATTASRWLNESGQHIEDLERLQEVAVPDLRKAVERIKKARGLSEKNAGRLAGHIEASRREPQTTAFDVVNGVTSFAKLMHDPDERDDLERYGGGLYTQFVESMKKGEKAAILRG